MPSMTPRQRAREVLRAHRYNLAALSTLPNEIRSLDLALTSARTSRPDRLPGGGDNDRLERIIERRDELKLRLEMAELSAGAVKRALDALRPDERRILEVMDIDRQKGAAERLREELCYSAVTTVYKFEARAADHFAAAMFGV